MRGAPAEPCAGAPVEPSSATVAFTESAMEPQITSWGNSLMGSLSAAMALLFAALPRVLGFLVILGIGWLVASLLEKHRALG